MNSESSPKLVAIGVATYYSKTFGSSATINSSSERHGDSSSPDRELGIFSKSGTRVGIDGTLVEIGLEVIGSLMIG